MSKRKYIAVHIHAWGDISHPKGDLKVDESYWRQMKESFDRFTEHRHPPVLRKHENDGLAWGAIVDLTTAKAGTGFDIDNTIEKPGIWAIIAPAPPLWRLWRDGLIRDWSPGVIKEFRSRHSDEVFHHLLREVSFVSMGHQHNTDTPLPSMLTMGDEGFVQGFTDIKEHEMAKEKDMQDDDKNYEDGDVMSAIEALGAQVGGLIERLDQLEERLDDAEEDDSDDDAEEPADMKTPADTPEQSEMGDEVAAQMSAYEERILQMEDQLKRAKMERIRDKARAEIAQRGIELEDSEADDMIQLACTDHEAFSAALNIIERNTKSEKTQKSQRFNFSEVGTSGQPREADSPRQEIIKMCDDALQGVDDRRKARRILQDEGLDWGDPRQARIGKAQLDRKFK